jgi:membrane protease subunit HflC
MNPTRLVLALFISMLIGLESLYIVDETEQIIVTQFGKPVGTPISVPGLRLKVPFIQKVNRFEKRFLEWDGSPNQIPTRDKRFIWVDTTARWQITDPLLFFQRLRDERGAHSRLDDILDGETRNTIAKHDLIDVVRTSNSADLDAAEARAGQVDPGNEAVEEAVEEVADAEEEATTNDPSEPSDQVITMAIEAGRDALALEVRESASAALQDLGVELLDFRFKRINYQEEVRAEVYTRMISERKRIAEQYRSEGAGEAARINGERERQLKVITSEAYREAVEIKGKADAEAADIYAAAYNRDPEFYAFLKSMELYPAAIGKDAKLVMGTDGPFFRYLGSAD